MGMSYMVSYTGCERYQSKMTQEDKPDQRLTPEYNEYLNGIRKGKFKRPRCRPLYRKKYSKYERQK